MIFKNLLKWLRNTTIALYAIIMLYYFLTGAGGPWQLAIIMVPLSAILYVLDGWYKSKNIIPGVKGVANYVAGAAFILVSITSMLYFNMEFIALRTVRMGSYTSVDLLIGTLAVITVLWYCLREYPVIFGILTFFIFHSLYGSYFPDPLYHRGISFNRLISVLTVDFSSGIYANLPQLALTVISAFMLFVGLLNGFGFVESIAKTVTSKIRSRRNLPLVNIFVGIPVGMVTGSAGAATATILSVTQPILKEIGIPLVSIAASAAAIGIGAQLMPPVMGASAFVMADALGVSYFDVAVRGFIPALVYYIGIATAIYYISAKYVRRDSTEVKVNVRVDIYDYSNILIFAVGIVVLVVLMGMWVYAPIAALRSASVVLSLAVVLLAFKGVKSRYGVKHVFNEVYAKVWRSLEFFAVETAGLTLLLASLAILQALFTVSGLSLKLGSALISISGGNLIYVVLLAYAFAYIVGTSVPPLGTFIILYPIVVPALMRLGVNPWVAQFTTFFLAVHAEFAPPVSVSAAVASRISKVRFTSVLRELVKMGLTLPLLIFVTPLKPTLVIAPGIEQIRVGALIAVGIAGLESAIYGDFLSNKYLNILYKAILGLLSLTTLFTDYWQTSLIVVFLLTSNVLLKRVLKAGA